MISGKLILSLSLTQQALIPMERKVRMNKEIIQVHQETTVADLARINQIKGSPEKPTKKQEKNKMMCKVGIRVT
jgi:hypothetical protein